MEFQLFLQTHSFLASLISFLFGMLAFPTLLKVAVRKNMVVRPNHRTSHKGVIPNIGGVSIFSTWFFTIIFFIIPSYRLFYFIAGAYFMMLVGLVDDLIIISPNKKLLGQIIAGFFLIILSHTSFTHFHGIFGMTQIPALWGILFTFLVFLFIVNAFNLIDGVDGLASGLGLISSLFFGVYFFLVGHTNLAVMAFALVGSLVIYFLYNVFGGRRKIFMGDSGSLVLGYLLSLFVIQFCEMNAYPNQIPAYLQMSAAPVVAFCVLAVPLFDTMRVIVTRLKKGNSPFHPDKNHVHHLMLSLGLSHRRVSYWLMTVNVAFIVLAIIGRNWSVYLLAAVTLLGGTVLTVYLWHLINRSNAKMNRGKQVEESFNIVMNTSAKD
ncbi:MAG: MraY family glycosyltransferase [Microbacter sp.]